MKKYIIGFVIGLVVAITVEVSATILFQANQIGFTPEDNNWNVNNLEGALNDLHANKSNIKVYDNYFVTKYGTEGYADNVSQKLPVGKYIVVAYNSEGTNWNTSGYSMESNSFNVTCDKNCVINKIDEHIVLAAGSGYCSSLHAIYKVEVVENDTTITHESVWAGSSNSVNRVTLSMQIVKLG